MDFAAIIKVADLGITAFIVVALLLVILRLAPKWIDERRSDRRDMLDVFKGFGQRVAQAMETQAAATAKLAECQARHDGESSASMDAVQMAISALDQRVNLIATRTEEMLALMRGKDC